MFIFIISTLQYLKMVILLKIFTWTRWINHTKMHIRFRKDLHVKKKLTTVPMYFQFFKFIYVYVTIKKHVFEVVGCYKRRTHSLNAKQELILDHQIFYKPEKKVFF